MKTKLLALFALFVAAILVLGCTGAQKQEDVEDEQQELQEDGEQPIVEPEKTVYSCPLDQNKIDLSCEEDEDCKLITCRSGAGDVDTCVGDATDYTGIESSRCICKVTGEYTSTDTEGNTVTVQTKQCRHTA